MPESSYKISYDHHYFNICKHNYLEFQNNNNKYKAVWDVINKNESRFNDEDDYLPNEYFKLNEKLLYRAAKYKNLRDSAGHITIIFSAMFLEALINHYAINKSSKTYFSKFLDKLDFSSKWIIVTRLFSSSEFNRSSKAFELINKIKTLRNGLVHFKTIIKQVSVDIIREVEEEEAQFAIDVNDSLKAMFLVVDELHRIDESWEDYRFYNINSDGNRKFKKYI